MHIKHKSAKKLHVPNAGIELRIFRLRGHIDSSQFFPTFTPHAIETDKKGSSNVNEGVLISMITMPRSNHSSET